MKKLTAREKYEAKKLSRDELELLASRKWAPVKLEKAAVPAALQGLPSDKVVAMFGSASLAEPNPTADGNPDRGQVGGIDVYRVAEADDGVALNKDWYAIYWDQEKPDVVYLVGPEIDAEHWIDDSPARLVAAEPISVARTLEAQSGRGPA